MVSVSGGSILAGHFATRWSEATKSTEGFEAVAAGLIRVTQSDIRNFSISKWIWCQAPLFSLLLGIAAILPVPSILVSGIIAVAIPLAIFIALVVPPSRVFFLQRKYKEHFGDITLGDLPPQQEAPWLALVATDLKQRQRVAFIATGIRRFDLKGEQPDAPIVAKGVDLSLAVAASSCFPPVFETLRLKDKELGAIYGEFPGELNLSDGGVAGNLGVEVAISLINMGFLTAPRLFICDAERPVTDEPSTTPLQAALV